MTINLSLCEEANGHIGHALRYYSNEMSADVREFLARAQEKLTEQCRIDQGVRNDFTRVGNLSPDYLLRQDQERRASLTTADGGAS